MKFVHCGCLLRVSDSGVGGGQGGWRPNEAVWKTSGIDCLAGTGPAQMGNTFSQINHTMESSQTTKRISVSLPGSVYNALDGIIQGQGFENRSQAIAEIIMARNSQLEQETGNEITCLLYTSPSPRD